MTEHHSLLVSVFDLLPATMPAGRAKRLPNLREMPAGWVLVVAWVACQERWFYARDLLGAFLRLLSSSGRRMGFSGILAILEVSNFQTVWERKTIRMRRGRSKHGSAPCAATSMSVPSRRRIARSAASRGSISTQSNSRLGLAFAGLPVSAAPLSCSRRCLGGPPGERSALSCSRRCVWQSRRRALLREDGSGTRPRGLGLSGDHRRPSPSCPRPASRCHAAGRGERRPNLREVPAGCEGRRLNLREVPAGWGGVQTLPAGVAPWCRALEAFCPPEAAIGGGYENNLAGATPSGRPPGPSTLPGPDFLPGPGRLMCL